MWDTIQCTTTSTRGKRKMRRDGNRGKKRNNGRKLPYFLKNSSSPSGNSVNSYVRDGQRHMVKMLKVKDEKILKVARENNPQNGTT